MSNKKTVNLKLIILGDKGIGKTTLINNYLQLPNSNKDNKDNKDKKDKEREKYVFLQEIDSAQLKITIYEFSEKNEKLTKDINDCHCVLIIFDMANRKSFENLLDNWLLYLRDICHYKGLVFIFGNHVSKSQPLMTDEDEIKEMIKVSEVECQFYNIGKNETFENNQIINKLIGDAFELSKNSNLNKKDCVIF